MMNDESNRPTHAYRIFHMRAIIHAMNLNEHIHRLLVSSSGHQKFRRFRETYHHSETTKDAWQ